MSLEREQLEAVIQGLEAQRGLLGEAFVDAGLAPLRARLAAVVDGLAEISPPAQTFKQVTILFLDIVGSTHLSQQLDAEDTHAVMNGALARCTAVVEAHGGKVLQYAGDSLLAVFGDRPGLLGQPAYRWHQGRPAANPQPRRRRRAPAGRAAPAGDCVELP